MYPAFSRLADGVARLMALAGGLLLLAIVALTCVSIIGRALYSAGICCGPIRGIYDYTEIGIGAAIFAFLPWCQIRSGHAAVDLFKPAMPNLMNRIINIVVDCGMLVVAFLIAHRLWLGMLDKKGYNETTLIAQVPVWIGYAACLVGAVCFAVVAGFCVVRSVRQLLSHDPELETQL